MKRGRGPRASNVRLKAENVLHLLVQLPRRLVQDLQVPRLPRRARPAGEELARGILDQARPAAAPSRRLVDRLEHPLVDRHRCLDSHTPNHTTPASTSPGLPA